MRDLPRPGSPETSTTWPSPALARAQRRNSRSISSSRPTSGVSADPRNASNRLSTALGRSTCHAGTGSAMPFSSTAPRSRYSKRSPTSRRVLAAITTVSGSAKACRRAARFGVSPTTDRCCAEPRRSIADDHEPGGNPDPRLQLFGLTSSAADRDRSAPSPHVPPARRRPHAPADSRNKSSTPSPMYRATKPSKPAIVSATQR